MRCPSSSTSAGDRDLPRAAATAATAAGEHDLALRARLEAHWYLSWGAPADRPPGTGTWPRGDRPLRGRPGPARPGAGVPPDRDRALRGDALRGGGRSARDGARARRGRRRSPRRPGAVAVADRSRPRLGPDAGERGGASRRGAPRGCRACGRTTGFTSAWCVAYIYYMLGRFDEARALWRAGRDDDRGARAGARVRHVQRRDRVCRDVDRRHAQRRSACCVTATRRPTRAPAGRSPRTSPSCCSTPGARRRRRRWSGGGAGPPSSRTCRSRSAGVASRRGCSRCRAASPRRAPRPRGDRDRRRDRRAQRSRPGGLGAGRGTRPRRPWSRGGRGVRRRGSAARAQGERGGSRSSPGAARGSRPAPDQPS